MSDKPPPLPPFHVYAAWALLLALVFGGLGALLQAVGWLP